jgi:Tol biopolymer transport system component
MKKIIFLKNGLGEDDVFILSLTTGLTENISKTPTVRDGWPVFSPNGKWIYFSSMDTEVYSIYKMKPDGSEKKQLTFPEAGEEDARVNISQQGNFFIYNKRSGSTISIMRSE